jgi:hypothetical protein
MTHEPTLSLAATSSSKTVMVMSSPTYFTSMSKNYRSVTTKMKNYLIPDGRLASTLLGLRAQLLLAGFNHDIGVHLAD